MDEINLIEKPKKNLEYYLQKSILVIGDRLAIILFVLSVPVLFLFSTPKAFSEIEKEVFVRQNTNWYEKSDPVVHVSTGQTSYSISSVEVTPTPTSIPTPTPVIVKSNNADSDIWEKLADCESHKNWGANTGNGYYGGLQFSLGAWSSAGGTGLPHEASRDEQISRGKIVQEKRGWGPWGACSKKLGLI